MPFPYSKLPYGQLRRLRELSTPVEVYDLQLAVGNQLDGLLPLQSTKNVHDVVFTASATPVQVYTHIDDAMPTFIAANVVFIVKQISVGHLFYYETDIINNVMANAVFDTLYLKKARKLSTVTDRLTVEFLQFLGHRVQHLTELTLDGPLYNVKLSDILASFTKPRVLEVQKINHGWVRDLLDADVCNIKIAIYGEENSFENIFSFNPTDLLQLLNKRCNISLICKNPYNETFEAQTAKISEYLGPSFMRLTTFVPLPNFAVGLKCILEPSGPDSFVRTTCIRFVSRALFEANGYIQNDVGVNFASESEI